MKAIDIFIGLVLVYFLYSLLVTIIVEMLSMWMGLRARHLRQGIENLLNDRTRGDDFGQWIKDIFLIDTDSFKASLAGSFYKQPEIRQLAKRGDNARYSIRNTKPSYISPAAYSKAITSMLSRKSQGTTLWERVQFSIKNNTIAFEEETLIRFQALLANSGGKYETFINQLEQEFEEMMDRVNGWYKRKIGFGIFWIGFLICLAGNVDSIETGAILSNDESTRKEFLQISREIAAQEEKLSDTMNGKTGADPVMTEQYLLEHYKKTKNEIEHSSHLLGLSWKFKKGSSIREKAGHIIASLLENPISLIGILITAFAVSMGAPFWFDLLKKLVAIRGAGTSPKENAGETAGAKKPERLPFDGSYRLTNDPHEMAVSENRRYWEALPGFVGFNKNGEKIEIAFDKEIPDDLPAKVKVLDGRIEVGLEYVVRPKGNISCNSSVGPVKPNTIRIDSPKERFGTIAGIVKNKRTGKGAILTAGHVVLKGTEVFFQKNEITVSICTGSSWREVGCVSNKVISPYFDAGLIDLDDDSLTIDPGISTIQEVYKITSDDKNSGHFEIHTNSGVKTCELKSISFFHTLRNDSDTDFRFFQLLRFEIGQNQKTDPGDSGSLITRGGQAAAMHIGGGVENGSNFSYALGLSDVFEALQLDVYKKQS